MTRLICNSVWALPTTLLIVCLPFVQSICWAQERHVVSFNAPASSTKFTQQHFIDVGDVPDHQLRVFELQRVYGADAPLVEGVRLREAWIHGMSDYTELNGLGIGYATYVMNNGDKIFAQGHFLAHRQANSGQTVLKNMTELTVTGGTGRFLGIRGFVRAETVSDNTAGINQNNSEMEYWMQK